MEGNVLTFVLCTCIFLIYTAFANLYGHALRAYGPDPCINLLTRGRGRLFDMFFRSVAFIPLLIQTLIAWGVSQHCTVAYFSLRVEFCVFLWWIVCCFNFAIREFYHSCLPFAHLRIIWFRIQEFFDVEPTVALFKIVTWRQLGIAVTALFYETLFDCDRVTEDASLVIPSVNCKRKELGQWSTISSTRHAISMATYWRSLDVYLLCNQHQ